MAPAVTLTMRVSPPGTRRYRSILGKLAEDGGEVDPHVLASDVAVRRELHDVQQPEFEGSTPTFEPEWRAGRAAPPHRLVYQEVLTV